MTVADRKASFPEWNNVVFMEFTSTFFFKKVYQYVKFYNFVTTLFEAVFIGTEYSRQGADGLSGNTPQGMRRSADFQNIQVTRDIMRPGIGSKLSIPPAYVVWRDRTTTLFVFLAH